MEIKCVYAEKCPFYLRTNSVHDAMYTTNISRYCDGKFETCALFQIIRDKDVASVPNDLYPNQSWRVGKILSE